MSNNQSYRYLKRRDFLSLLALTGAASFLPLGFIACTDEKTFTGTGKVPFKVWEEMQHALQSSPGFLPDRVEILVELGDSEDMFNLVRDKIVIVIPCKHNLKGIRTQLKTGIKEILPCRMAKNINSGLSKEVGQIMDGLDKIIELMSGKKNAFSYPS